MAIREIRKKGDPCLEKVCHPVTEFNERLHLLLDDMRETLEESGGVGLAAPQVGILKRVVVIDVGDERIELVNPVIIAESGTQVGPEGCLSVPGVFGEVERPNEVTVRAQDRNGNTYTKHLEGLFCRCACHETDHLDGQLFTRLVEEYVEPEEVK